MPLPTGRFVRRSLPWLLGSSGRSIAQEVARRGAGPVLRSRLDQVGPMPKRRRTTHRLVDAVLGPAVQYGFIASIAAAVFAIFNSAFDSLAGDGTWQAAVKLGIGVALAGIGVLLAFDLHGARWLLLNRLLGRARSKGREPAGFLGAVSWRMRNPLFALIGFAWLGLGLLEVARGAGGLV